MEKFAIKSLQMEHLKNRVGMVSSLQFFALCKYNCITNTYLVDVIYKVY